MQVIGLNYKIEQVIGLIRSSFQTSFKFLLSDKHISFRIFCSTNGEQRKDCINASMAVYRNFPDTAVLDCFRIF